MAAQTIVVRTAVAPLEPKTPKDLESGFSAQRRQTQSTRRAWVVIEMLSSFSPFTSDVRAISRRIAMWAIVATRIAMFVLAILSGIRNVAQYSVTTSVGIFDVLAVVYSLYLIDRRTDMGGVTMCFFRWNDAHFNVAVHCLAVLALGVFFGRIFEIEMAPLNDTWVWLVTLAMGYIAALMPEEMVFSVGVVSI